MHLLLERANPCSVSEGDAARVLAARVRRAALVGVGPWLVKAHYASEMANFLGARPCSDMLAAVSN